MQTHIFRPLCLRLSMQVVLVLDKLGAIMEKFKCVLKNRAQDEKIFRISYILCLFLSSLCFIEKACLGLTTLNMLWALYFFKKRFSSKKNIKQICCYALLLLFLISGVITAFLNKEDITYVKSKSNIQGS